MRDDVTTAVNKRGGRLREYPPVSRLTTRGQWFVVACTFLLFTILRFTDTVRAVGGVGDTWQIIGLRMLYTGWLLAFAWTVWYILDKIPFASGHRWRNGALRVLLSWVVTNLDRIFLIKLLRLGLSPERVDALCGSKLVAGYSIATCAILILAHIVLQRSHEQRQQIALERSLVETRLHALSLELQPHFLFNAMNGIAALVREDPGRAERMLVRLSDLLRLTLRGGSDSKVSLRQELEQLDLYLDLQMMRFGSRLTVTREVDPAALDGQVPHLLLQPLVENALTHGIAPRAGPGLVALTARRENDTLLLKVCDDGAGLPPPVHRRERTGIGTTRARLAAMFGDGHSLTLAPAPNGGAEVTIRIPFLPMPVPA